MENKSRSAALLTELIVVVLIFTLCACILVQLFSFSVSLGNKAGAKTEALNTAQNAMELLGSGAGAERLTELGFTGETGYYTLTGEEFTLTAAVTEEPRPAGTMLLYTVTAVRGEETLFTLTGKTYRGQ